MQSLKSEEALQIIENENETPCFVQECRVYQNSIFYKKRFIYVTERSIFYFSKRMKKHKFNLFKVKSIFIDKYTITLGFIPDSKFKISISKNYQDLKENLINSLIFAIQHLLSNLEIEHIHFTNNNPNSLSKLTSIPSYYGAFCNFEASLRDEFFNFHTQSNDILDQIRFRFSILFHRKLVKLSSYKNKEYSYNNILRALSLLPSARYLSIKQYRNINIYSLLNNYISNFNELESISVDGNVDYQNDTASFNNFINSMKTNLNSKMVGLSFLNSNFRENHLDLISKYVLSNKIEALEFHKTFSDKTVTNFFITTFLTSLSQSPFFTSLYIDEIEFLDIDNFLENLPEQIKSLSIVNCDIKINQIFTTIKTNSKFSNNLNVLNLSYNTFHQESLIKFDIPSFLTVIILDYVTFPDGILIPFLNSLFRTIKNDSKISLVQMKASEDDFFKLDKMFYFLVSDYKNKKEEIKFIHSLNWNFNPISTYFISFLKLQTKLKSLSVSGCFCPKDSKGFEDFCFYLASNDSLEKLTCRRFNQTSLESLTPRLLSAVSYSKISFLDISNSRGGSVCYDFLKSIIDLNNIKQNNETDNQNKANNETDENLDYEKIDIHSSSKKLNNDLNDELINNQNQTNNETDENLGDEKVGIQSSNNETDGNLDDEKIGIQSSNNKINKNLNDELINNQNQADNETDENLNSEEFDFQFINDEKIDEQNKNNEINKNLNDDEIINNNNQPNSNDLHTKDEENQNLNDEINNENDENLNNMNLENQKNEQTSHIINPTKVNHPNVRNFSQLSHENFRSSQNLNFSKASNLKCVIYDGLMPFNKIKLMEFIEFISKNQLSNKFSFPIHDIEYLFKKQKMTFDDITKIISQCQIKTQNDYIKPFTVFYNENQHNFPFHFIEDFQQQVIDLELIESELKTVSFFGIYHELFDPSNIKDNDPYIFSFHSDDDDDENDDFYSMKKYPNSKKSEFIYSKSYSSMSLFDDEKNKSTKSNVNTIIEEEDESSSYSMKKISSTSSINNNNNDNDDDYSYSYSYSKEEKNIIKPIQNKTIPLNKRFPLMRPIIQRRVLFNRTLNNNIAKKKPVLQINLDDSDYDYYSYYSDDEK